MSLTIIFGGVPELRSRLKDITEGLSDSTAQRAYLGAAQALAARARANAPRDTGRLKKAIISRGFKDANVLRYGPGAYAQVNLRKQATTAPYGHIVESGRIATDKSKRKGVRTSGFAGRFYFARAVEAIGMAELEKATANLNTTMKRRYLLY